MHFSCSIPRQISRDESVEHVVEKVVVNFCLFDVFDDFLPRCPDYGHCLSNVRSSFFLLLCDFLARHRINVALVPLDT
jgi:hypothetical protein